MARPTLYAEARKTTAIRIPESLHEDLHDAAREWDMSANQMIVLALEEYLLNLGPRCPVGSSSEGPQR